MRQNPGEIAISVGADGVEFAAVCCSASFPSRALSLPFSFPALPSNQLDYRQRSTQTSSEPQSQAIIDRNLVGASMILARGWHGPCSAPYDRIRALETCAISLKEIARPASADVVSVATLSVPSPSRSPCSPPPLAVPFPRLDYRQYVIRTSSEPHPQASIGRNLVGVSMIPAI